MQKQSKTSETRKVGRKVSDKAVPSLRTFRNELAAQADGYLTIPTKIPLHRLPSCL